MNILDITPFVLTAELSHAGTVEKLRGYSRIDRPIAAIDDRVLCRSPDPVDDKLETEPYRSG
ncbi:MAG: hypothetical protein J2P54_06010 [Bradyrhizobiaceae bacterium]|nr:hypothetical protein [Bradyrhizobiaceae bacterium]